jgi:hypothetical protein
MERISITEGRKILSATAPEKQVQQAIVEYLAAQRIPFAVTDATEAFNRRHQRICRVTPGWPDITACDQEFIAIECKRAVGGVLSAIQAQTLSRLHERGALVVVARSVDDVIALLRDRRTSAETIAEIAEAIKREGQRDGRK